jgi:hypothetical protein
MRTENSKKTRFLTFRYITQQILCKTLSLNKCLFLTIDQTKPESLSMRKPGIVIVAR